MRKATWDDIRPRGEPGVERKFVIPNGARPIRHPNERATPMTGSQYGPPPSDLNVYYEVDMMKFPYPRSWFEPEGQLWLDELKDGPDFVRNGAIQKVMGKSSMIVNEALFRIGMESKEK